MSKKEEQLDVAIISKPDAHLNDDSESFCMACSEIIKDSAKLVCLECLGDMYIKAAEKKNIRKRK